MFIYTLADIYEYTRIDIQKYNTDRDGNEFTSLIKQHFFPFQFSAQYNLKNFLIKNEMI